MDKCYFICFISITRPLTVIEVYRDEEFISNMIPKLMNFYKDCILPEIILRRVQKNAKCIDLNEISGTYHKVTISLLAYTFTSMYVLLKMCYYFSEKSPFNIDLRLKQGCIIDQF